MYTDTDTVKKYSGVDWDNTLDSFIESLIKSAQDYVENYCGGESFDKRVFNHDGTEETREYDGTGEPTLYIDDARDISKVDIEYGPQDQVEEYKAYPLNETVKTRIKMKQYNKDLNVLNSRRRLYAEEGLMWPRGEGNIHVTAKFGYSEDVPDLINICTARIVSGLIQENIGDNDVQRVTSEQLGDYQLDYATMDKVANRVGVTSMLDRYRRPPKGNKSKMRTA